RSSDLPDLVDEVRQAGEFGAQLVVDVDEVPAEGAGDVVVADVGTGLGAGGAGALVPQLPAARAEAGAVVGRGGDAEAFVLAAAGGGGRGLLLRGGRFGGEHGAGG